MTIDTMHESLVRHINCVTCEPGKQAEALSVMTRRAEFMSRQPGFISVCLHRSLDGQRLVTVIEWQNRETLHEAHQSAEFRKEWNRFDDLTGGIDPHLYEVALVKGAGQALAAARESEPQQHSQTIAEEARNVNNVMTHR